MRTKKQTLLIIRGLPGSGKSTYAKKKRGYLHYETDMFFVDRKTGIYNFDPRKLGYAHQWCLDSTKKALLAGEDVIVSNTFTTVREMLPYLDLAHELGIQVKVVHCTGEYKSEHGVPDSTLQKMKDRWEAFEGEKTYHPRAKRD